MHSWITGQQWAELCFILPIALHLFKIQLFLRSPKAVGKLVCNCFQENTGNFIQVVDVNNLSLQSW